MDLAEKLEILRTAPNMMYPVPPAGWIAPDARCTGQQCGGGHLPRLHGGRAVRLPPEGALLQRVQLRLQLLRQPPLQRQTRATFTPRELAELTIGFYRRNYIEGLFLSSAVLGTPDRTMELMIEALRILREEYHFNGYIHAKTIPGADPMLVEKIGRLADRLSVNIELPSETSLTTLAPDKKKTAILRPMGQIAVQSAQSKKEMVLYRGAKPFAPVGRAPNDHRGDAGDRPSYHGPDRGTLQEILAEARVLLGLSASGGGSPPARTAHGPSPAAGAPSVSGGLAAAVLPFFGPGAADRGRAEF